MLSSQLPLLTDKHVIVAGSEGLLGATLVEELSRGGAFVSRWDIAKLERGDGGGDRTLIAAIDVTDESAVHDTYQLSASRFGPPHCLINLTSHRGLADDFFKPVEKVDVKEWSSVVQSNLQAAMVLSRTIGVQMAREGRGSILHAASIYGPLGVDQRIYEGVHPRMNAPLSYAVAKAGILGLTRYFATLWGEHGVRVNCVAPGGIEHDQSPIFQNAYSERVPLRRMATLDEVAYPMIFLSSGLASYITGQCIFIDGGLSAW